MTDMFESWLGPTLGSIVFYTVILLILLVVLGIVWFVYKILRRPRLASGKRSIQARLAVTDAATIDARRRLVLVRRDEVEHLIMIGGPTDIVIESDIRRMAAARPRTTPSEVKSAQTPAQQAVPTKSVQEQPAKPKPTPLKLTPETTPQSSPAPSQRQNPPPQPTPKPVTSPQPSAPLPGTTIVGAVAGAAVGGVSAVTSKANEKITDTAASLAMPKEALEAKKPNIAETAQSVAPKTSEPTSAQNDVDALLEEIALPDK